MSLFNTSTPSITVLTPTWNRRHLLPRLYQSLLDQQAPQGSFEWLVVDDGSTDGTSEWLEALKLGAPFDIRIKRQENGGKHRAINNGARNAIGSWILLVDSDDLLMHNAVKTILEQIKKVESDLRIGLIRGLKVFPELDHLSHFYVKNNPSTHTEWVTSQKSFDSAEVIKTSALLQHPFPEFEGEKFMAEGYLWHSLERTHLTYFVNEPWITCFYQDEGLSSRSRVIRSQSPKSAQAVYEMMLSSPLNLELKIRCQINWWRYFYHTQKMYGKCEGIRIAQVWAKTIGWWLYKKDLMLIHE